MTVITETNVSKNGEIFTIKSESFEKTSNSITIPMTPAIALKMLINANVESAYLSISISSKEKYYYAIAFHITKISSSYHSFVPLESIVKRYGASSKSSPKTS